MSRQGFSPTPGTAIAAAVLGFLIAVRQLAEAAVYFLQLFVDGGLPEYVVGLLWNVAVAAALVVGGILLLRRKNSGRVLLVTAVAVSLLATLFVPDDARIYFFTEAIGETQTSSDIRSFGLFGMAVAALVLALIRPTADWLEGKRKDDEEPSKQDRLPGW
ncbi:hypothetical protein [Amycolatopsis pittospori]|uniref:hypothetical protein n=1 Tax=Amycolatopsis pittospori TaxID=2749434 RepID=UPI0015F08CC3|nr:hypothetical protein [Amycolatopsis pittospori]